MVIILVDIMEYKSMYPNVIYHVLHHGGVNAAQVETGGPFTFGADFSRYFTNFALEWTKERMTWFVNDSATFSVELNRWWNVTQNGIYTAPYQPWEQRFHIILNVAVSGLFYIFGTSSCIYDSSRKFLWSRQSTF